MWELTKRISFRISSVCIFGGAGPLHWLRLHNTALSFSPDPEQIISDPDPGISSGSDRIRIHDTATMYRVQYNQI